MPRPPRSTPRKSRPESSATQSRPKSDPMAGYPFSVPHPLTPIHIRPISDLRNKSQEVSELAHETNRPVFITKNGREDLVVLSMAAWEDLYVYPRLLEAELDEAMGDKGRDFDEVMDEIARKHGYGKYANAGSPKKKGGKRSS